MTLSKLLTATTDARLPLVAYAGAMRFGRNVSMLEARCTTDTELRTIYVNSARDRNRAMVATIRELRKEYGLPALEFAEPVKPCERCGTDDPEQNFVGSLCEHCEDHMHTSWADAYADVTP